MHEYSSLHRDDVGHVKATSYLTEYRYIVPTQDDHVNTHKYILTSKKYVLPVGSTHCMLYIAYYQEGFIGHDYCTPMRIANE